MSTLLLAQQAVENPTWAALRDSMRKEGQFADHGGMAGLGWVVAGAALAVLLAWAVQRLRPTKHKVLGAPPKRLFLQAAKSLGIGYINRIVLLRAAYASRLDHPTLMLLTPHLMEEHAGEWADRFPVWSLRRTLRARINQMSRDIFGDPQPETPVAPESRGQAPLNV